MNWPEIPKPNSLKLHQIKRGKAWLTKRLLVIIGPFHSDQNVLIVKVALISKQRTQLQQWTMICMNKHCNNERWHAWTSTVTMTSSMYEHSKDCNNEHQYAWPSTATTHIMCINKHGNSEQQYAWTSTVAMNHGIHEQALQQWTKVHD